MTEDLIRVERSVAAAPATVYRYLTSSEGWARWQGIGADVEALPGGRWAMTMGNGMVATGRFTELVDDRRVVFTWGWEGHPTVPPGSTTVTIELVPEGESTRVVLTHSGLPADEIPMHTAGWNHYLPRLVLVAEGIDPGVDPGPG